jgi:transcriptional regulator with XRE-family HTH domain
MSESALIGAAIKSARKAQGRSQGDLAATLGVSRAAVAMWESGGSSFSVDRLAPLCATLGITPNDLLLGAVQAAEEGVHRSRQDAIKERKLERARRLRRKAELLEEEAGA